MAETILYEANQDAMEGDEAALFRAAQGSLAGFKQHYLQWLAPVYRYFYFRTGNKKDVVKNWMNEKTIYYQWSQLINFSHRQVMEVRRSLAYSSARA